MNVENKKCTSVPLMKSLMRLVSVAFNEEPDEVSISCL